MIPRAIAKKGIAQRTTDRDGQMTRSILLISPKWNTWTVLGALLTSGNNLVL